MDSLLVLTMPDPSVGGVQRVGGGPSGVGPGGVGNPGRTRNTALSEAISTLRTGADVQVCPVAMPGDLDGALHRRGSRTVVVAGGDSGLHSVVSALHRRNELDDAVLAMLPTGPSNFAYGAGIPASPIDAARIVLGGTQRRFDMIVDCRGDVVVNGASVVGRTNRTHRALAGLGTVAGISRATFTDLASRPLRVQVVADDKVVTDFDRPVLGVRVNNCPTGTGTRHGCPEADPCDGYADLVVSFASRGLQRVQSVLRPPNHHVARADVLRVRAQRVSVAGQWFSLATDGEDTGDEQRCTWSVMPERLRFIVPS